MCEFWAGVAKNIQTDYGAMVREKMKKEFKFFGSLSDEDLQNLLDFCEYKQMPAGEILWNEGDDDNYAVFIVSGKLGIKKETEFDGKYVIVGTYGKGSVAGELCLLTDDKRSVTAEVIEPADIVILASKKFEGLLSNHPMLGLKLLKNIFLTTCKRLNKSYDRIAAIF